MLRKIGPESGPLPPLREELTLHEGPSAESGAPTWSLQDPVRNAYFRIDWISFEILSRWHLGNPEAIVAAIEEETTLHLDEKDIQSVVDFLLENELLLMSVEKATDWYLQRQARRQQSGWRWLLHHYLFFRIPLWQPDRFLQRLLPLVAPLFSRTFRTATFVALGIGVVEAARQWEYFQATLVDTFSWQGLAGYAVALSFIKLLHELGHAFTAKRFGCRVPTMGVAFLVLWPLAYTDVNDVWKLKSREQRLAVGAAGIVTELTVAAWATLLWAILPDGVLRGVVFLLATTTWISTLAINASPFLRFDGYFLLCDWLDMPNLHARAFALARWRLRETLFALGNPPPEVVPSVRRPWLILFAYVTWVYRLVVFLGIAVLVYQFAIKAVGIVLGVVEIVWFIALPVWNEIKVWIADAERIRASRRARQVGYGVFGLLVLTVLPLQIQISAQALLRPANSYPIVAPVAGRIAELQGTNGSAVPAGSSILTLEAPELELRKIQTQQKMLFAGWLVGAAGVDVQTMGRLPVLRQELATVTAEAAGVAQEMAKLANPAPFDGVVIDLEPDLQTGDWLRRHERVGNLIQTDAWIVDTYLDEHTVGRIRAGDSGKFFPETAGATPFNLEVERIDRDASRTLPERILAAPHGGILLAREKDGALIPAHSVYKVTLRVTGIDRQSLPQGERRGLAVIYGRPATLLGDFVKTAGALLVRESGM